MEYILKCSFSFSFYFNGTEIEIVTLNFHFLKKCAISYLNLLNLRINANSASLKNSPLLFDLEQNSFLCRPRICNFLKSPIGIPISSSGHEGDSYHF